MICCSSSRVCTIQLSGTGSPISRISVLNSSRSSAFLIDSQRRAEQLDVVLVQHARVRKLDRQVQPGLAAQRRQQAVRPLLLDHASANSTFSGSM